MASNCKLYLELYRSNYSCELLEIQVWEINNASRTERLAELVTTNTNVDELVEDNKYLIVDKL